MSKFLSKVTNIFFEETDKGDVDVDVKVKKRKSKIPSKILDFTNTSSTPVPEQYQRNVISNQSQAAIQGQFNEEFFNHFHGEIESNDLEGADYYEFRKTFEALKKSPNMSEIGALQAAFNVLRATAPELTVSRLLETADFYLDVIDKENEDFINQLNDKINVEVSGRQQTINDAEVLQQEKLDLITKLQGEINESVETVTLLKNEIYTEETKLNEVKSNWDFTINLVRKNIETDKTNIETHLK
jgi:hypothetical protein